MARQGANPVLRFVIALLIVLAVAVVAFFVGYLVGGRLAGAVPVVPVAPWVGVV